MLDSLSKKKLTDTAILAIATFTVIGTYLTQNYRIDRIEIMVKDNTQWRVSSEKSLDSISKSLKTIEPIDVFNSVERAKHEILAAIADKNK